LGDLPAWLTASREANEHVIYRNPLTTDHGEPVSAIRRSDDGSYFRIAYGDGIQFIVDSHGANVWATWRENLTLDDAQVYLLGQVMGFILRVRGIVCLHASAIAIDGRAVAIAGQAGAGKSTTAAVFARLGYPVLSDDVVPILDRGDTFWVPSGYPCVCLWPESVESVFGSTDALPLLSPTWDKRYLPLEGEAHKFQKQPLPLSRIYILGERGSAPDYPARRQLSSAQALRLLMANVYMNYVWDRDSLSRELHLLGRIATAIPLVEVQAHENLNGLERLCVAIVEENGLARMTR
jgi:hypothetical protein